MLIELSTLIILKINAIRTQLELWQVVKENFDEYFKTGLCLLIFQLRYRNIINYEEKFLLEKELIEYGNYDTYFLGEPKDPKSRLEFIEKMIKKHSENAITENK